MAEKEQQPPVVLSEDAARSGVTGHNVRYVLAFGLAGIIIAFLVIATYFGYGALAEKVSRIEGLSWRKLLLYAGPVVIAGLAAGILFGLWNMVAGRSEDASQTFMRWRVVLQFIAICLVMAALYLSGK